MMKAGFLAHTGIRIGEALALRCGDVDCDVGMLVDYENTIS